MKKIIPFTVWMLQVSCSLDMSEHYRCDDNSDCGKGYLCAADNVCVGDEQTIPRNGNQQMASDNGMDSCTGSEGDTATGNRDDSGLEPENGNTTEEGVDHDTQNVPVNNSDMRDSSGNNFDTDTGTDISISTDQSTDAGNPDDTATISTIDSDTFTDEESDSYLNNTADSGEDNDTDVIVDVSARVTFVNLKGYSLNRHFDDNVNGSAVNLWTSNNSPSQDWYFATDGSIRSASDIRYCLNVQNSNFSAWAVVNLWECQGSAAQKWVLSADTLRPSEDTDLCVNLHNDDNRNGATINLWDCTGHDSQKWQVVRH
ncbi:MAG: ricin-type beta-trefoil lectin domain protein [Deltaproteobacteria bacterium]|nr:ricin-type beta-trefoil lectin domain protein [Deltaproteobacteria bacterium]